MNDATNKSDAQETAAAEAQQALGQLLRETREGLGLDIAEVARVLRISQRYLEALEDGRNQDLPGTTYAIGFVRSYGEHLNLDGEEIVRRYKAEATGSGVKSDLVFPKPIPDSGVPGAAVLGLGLIVAAVAYGVWYYNSNDDVTVVRVEPVPEHMAATDEVSPATPEQAASESVASQAISEETQVVVEAEKTAEQVVATVGEEAPTAEAEPQAAVEPAVEPVAEPVTEPVVEAAAEAVEPQAPVEEAAPVAATVETPAVETPPEATVAAVAEAAASAEAAPSEAAPSEAAPSEAAPSEAVPSEAAAGEDGPSRITVHANANSWIQVRDEALDRLLFTRLLRAGDEYEVPNRPGLSLMTGNAGALELRVDGKAIPSLGAMGEVRRNVQLDPDKLLSGQ